jgi:tetratricopeptide (TPR) repeat protein
MQRAHRWLLVLSLALAACQAVPPAAPGPAAKDLAALAAEALESGDYAKAADLYRRALAAAPESVPLHYGLGVSASYLERRDEAIREFRWVLERGLPTSEEVRAARRWLEVVGALPRTTTVGATDETEEPKEGTPKPATASVRGRATFGGNPGDVGAMERMQLFLHSYPNRATYLRIRTDENGRYQFTNLPPGTYKLTDRIAGSPRWRLRVELKPGQDLTLDLDPANSTRVRDDFPDSTQAVGPHPS